MFGGWLLFKRKELENKGWGCLTVGSDIDRALFWAEQHGYIAKHVVKPAKGRSSETYYINPAALPDDDQSEESEDC